jgi:hypothetical protein
LWTWEGKSRFANIPYQALILHRIPVPCGRLYLPLYSSTVDVRVQVRANNLYAFYGLIEMVHRAEEMRHGIYRKC